LDEVARFSKILLSPGPGVPKDAGIMPELIQHYGPSKSILGVCLGHQAIGEAFGSKLHNLSDPLHGVSSQVNIVENDYLFANCPRNFNIAHYHSWVVDPENYGQDIQVTAKDSDGNIMAITHKIYDVKGVQFHPESVLTEHGIQIIETWLNHGR
jgi:anthranilate synthase component II